MDFVALVISFVFAAVVSRVAVRRFAPRLEKPTSTLDRIFWYFDFYPRHDRADVRKYRLIAASTFFGTFVLMLMVFQII